MDNQLIAMKLRPWSKNGSLVLRIHTDSEIRHFFRNGTKKKALWSREHPNGTVESQLTTAMDWGILFNGKRGAPLGTCVGNFYQFHCSRTSIQSRSCKIPVRTQVCPSKPVTELGRFCTFTVLGPNKIHYRLELTGAPGLRSASLRNSRCLGSPLVRLHISELIHILCECRQKCRCVKKCASLASVGHAGIQNA
jgi:hypothetical protein